MADSPPRENSSFLNRSGRVACPEASREAVRQRNSFISISDNRAISEEEKNVWNFKWRFGKRGWLRPWILNILGQSPKNGAEIMDDIEKLTWGHWRPSPGSVYPLLDDLTTEGIVKKGGEGKYELTEAGREESGMPFGPFGQAPTSVESMLSEMSSFVSYFEDLSKTDKDRLSPHREKLKELASRLSRVGGTP